MPSSFSFVFVFFIHWPRTLGQIADFLSVDCGGKINHTDQRTGLPWISDNHITTHGTSTFVKGLKEQLIQYQTRRDFPIDKKKYCYTILVKVRRRYLVRTTFHYGSFESEYTYPKFDIYLDATKWSTVTILEASRVYVKELIAMATSPRINVCLCCATTGAPFISTLELRPLNLSMYATDFEDKYFLEVAARVNFGAQDKDAVRYPHDPYDRIWDSDLIKRPNYLVGVAPGTTRISTSRIIDVNTREYPPIKVMQTAVVGTAGTLSYRLNLDDFPANARAYAYFAEIEDLNATETRKFRLQQPYLSDYSNAIINIAENANGIYKLYEPSYMNVSLDFVLSFSFVKTQDSSHGPLLNALEISKYLKIAAMTESLEVMALLAFCSLPGSNGWEDVDGDPCLPVPWDWVSCSAESPPRITKIILSRKKLTGEIPIEINNLKQLIELWLDGNFFTGSLPDMSNLVNLKILHVENNKLTGSLPRYLSHLPNLKELYLQNNSFVGEVPLDLISGKTRINFQDNPELHKEKRGRIHVILIVGASLGIIVFIFLLWSLPVLYNLWRKQSAPKNKKQGNLSSRPIDAEVEYVHSLTPGSHQLDDATAYRISFAELEEATKNFSKKIGRGSFGDVYYGQLKSGKEVAVKIMTDLSHYLTRQFHTEVVLLSRIHHKNLVPLIGYCLEENRHILAHEYMRNGRLYDHLHGSMYPGKLDWLTRLQIAEDAAKGLEYLHFGCNPSIVHRDIKTTNILLDANMRARVSDFGLSRQAEEGIAHVSSAAPGTVGYLDPEYYANQQLTEKSDVYSFGVVLLELISGRKPVSVEDFGSSVLSIVHWARGLIRKGEVMGIMDIKLMGLVKMESFWRIAEVAMQCVEECGGSRPRMQDVILAIQEAIKIEKGTEDAIGQDLGTPRAQSSGKTLLTSFLEAEDRVL